MKHKKQDKENSIEFRRTKTISFKINLGILKKKMKEKNFWLYLGGTIAIGVFIAIMFAWKVIKFIGG